MSGTGRMRRGPSRVVRSAGTQAWFLVADQLRLRTEQRRFARLPTALVDRVSVPIATYDRIDVLVERTVPALLDQTHQDVEVIVVGDGTPPELFARLDAIDDPRLVRIRLPERTRYPSDPLERWMVAGWRPRNVGASMASGGWLLWMSDDDLILPHGIATLVECARTVPSADLISGGFEVRVEPPRLHLPGAVETGLPFDIAGMPALLARVYTRAFRWNARSHLRGIHRPSDYDLLMRMDRAGMTHVATDAVVAAVLPVAGTNSVGSRAFAIEDRRRADGTCPRSTGQSEDSELCFGRGEVRGSQSGSPFRVN